MLTIIDVPPEVEELYRKSKLSADIIVRTFSSAFPSLGIDRQTDVCAAHPSSMIIVRNGVFQYSINKKLIRYYSTGDIISTPAVAPAGMSVVSEFGVEASIIPCGDFLKLLVKDPALLGVWFEYQRAADLLMHLLCSLYVKEDFAPHSELRQYQPGETVICEGDAPDYLFEMLEGSAKVTAKKMHIGMVNAGEVFGEMSFLTGTERGATVIADAPCLVQAIKRPDLEAFARHRPGLIYKLSQTLAQRLNEVNKRLVSITSMT